MPAASRPPHWQSLRHAATQTLAEASREPERSPTRPGLMKDLAASLKAVLEHRLEAARRAVPVTGPASPSGAGSGGQGRRRTDLRLVPAAVLVWATALAGGWLTPQALAGLGTIMAAVAALLLLSGRRTMRPAASFRGTLAAALLLGCVAGAHAAVAAVPRHEGALADAMAAGAAVVAEIEVNGAPRHLPAPGRGGSADRWAVPASLLVFLVDGRQVETRAPLVVLGGGDWAAVGAGERIRTTGKLKPAGDGSAAGILATSSAPLRHAPGGRTAIAPALWRSGFSAASAALPGDARGLLPGMVTGDTGTLDPQLAAAMKKVGMTHLTAVSGANCSLVLGALLFAARSVRLPRPAAAGLALGGLGLFVLMVGPDASVLRAAVMGTIGLAALVFGRAGRGLSMLCLAVTALLLADPALAGDFGFLLSVLATLGIVSAGRTMMGWLPAVVPRALAAGVAVPLSAQLFCGPVIVLLQPQFSSYALAANLAAAPLVAPVTLAGTAAVPLVPLAPALAAVPIAAAGWFASAVAGVARFFAGLPGAALPWPEGTFGAVTMAVLSTLTLLAAWLLSQPAGVGRLLLGWHDWIAARLAAAFDPKTGPPTGPSAGPSAGRPRPRLRGRGLVDRCSRGRLRTCKPTPRRNHQWLLPRPNAPRPRPRTPPPGVM
jgi:competence protein ComEC